MDRGIIPLVLAGVLGVSLASAEGTVPASNVGPTASKSLFSLWAELSQPMPGEAQPIGSYAAGCLAGAERLAVDGPGYCVMRPSRLRYFGHPELVRFITELGSKRAAHKDPLLLVGDLGRPRGGPMQSGHASHQIGLDVDLWFDTAKKKPNSQEREARSATTFVKGETKLTKAWGQPQRKLVAAAAESPLVDRIFVHATIKRDLCRRFKGAPWLYKVRAWWGHKDHFHVRLACPKGSTACKAQEALDPKKEQCGKELAWWFTKEAIEEWKKKQAIFAEREFPVLPAECGQMVNGLRAEAKGVPRAEGADIK